MTTQTSSADVPSVSAEYVRLRRRTLAVCWGSFALLIPGYAAYRWAGPGSANFIFWLLAIASIPFMAYAIATWRCPNCRHFLSFNQRNYFAERCPRCQASFLAGETESATPSNGR